MKYHLALAAALALAANLTARPALAAAEHPCAADSLQRAQALLAYHVGEDDRIPLNLRRSAQKVGTVRAISGKGRFDVLQVWGQAYKAEYRIRLIYAQVQGSCTLMGQEILESSNPY